MERAAYRIVDANFNRAREAVRVIEDFCRFALNSAQLSGRAKQLRHELSAAIDRLDAGRLLSSRDTLGDVGVVSVQRTADSGQRTGFLHAPRSTLYANFKRLTEALRTLAEVMRALPAAAGENLSAAEAIEKLRYDAYTLEKDIYLFGEPAEKFKPVELYVIISSSLPADIIALTHRCLAGGADCIQLRAKDIADDTLLAVAVEFVEICRAVHIISIINDRVDVAVAAGADGVHLGQNDLPVEQARKLQAVPLIIGKSTHSLEQLRSACLAYPTYVSLGPVFSTGTKPTAEPVGLDYVRDAINVLADTGIAGVAIGGITPESVVKVLEAGAKKIAVCSAVTEVADPVAACRALKQKIAAFKRKKEPNHPFARTQND